MVAPVYAEMIVRIEVMYYTTFCYVYSKFVQCSNNTLNNRVESGYPCQPLSITQTSLWYVLWFKMIILISFDIYHSSFILISYFWQNMVHLYLWRCGVVLAVWGLGGWRLWRCGVVLTMLIRLKMQGSFYEPYLFCHSELFWRCWAHFYSYADDLNYLTDVIAILFSGKLYIAHKYQIQVISINDKLE
jgi:hypothetical protein